MKLNRREFSRLGVAAAAVGAGSTLLAVLIQTAGAQPSVPPATGSEHDPRPLFVKADELQWAKMFPEWETGSPEIVLLRVDPNTQATHLIRTPKKMHVPRHWHSAHETHTILRGTFTFECDGQRSELGPGGFNYIPARMIHQAWVPDDGLVLITVDAAWDINWVDGPPPPPQSTLKKGER